jgi:hypothetical protein
MEANSATAAPGTSVPTRPKRTILPKKVVASKKAKEKPATKRSHYYLLVLPDGSMELWRDDHGAYHFAVELLERVQETQQVEMFGMWEAEYDEEVDGYIDSTGRTRELAKNEHARLIGFRMFNNANDIYYGAAVIHLGEVREKRAEKLADICMRAAAGFDGDRQDSKEAQFAALKADKFRRVFA